MTIAIVTRDEHENKQANDTTTGAIPTLTTLADEFAYKRARASSGSDSGHEHEREQCTQSSGVSSSSAIDDDGEESQLESTSDEDQVQSECFEDANDYVQASGLESQQITINQDDDFKTRDSSFDLKAQLEETRHVLELALNNQFIRALEICGARANEELYSGLAYATLCFLRASLTMEPSDLEAAVNGINKTFEVASRARRKTSMFSRLLYKPNYDQYTDEEIHAELVEAESLLLLSLISFLSDQSVICLVRSAIRIRACYQRYKECMLIMKTRTNWSSELARRHFESGVRMGHGTFNLLMSYLPRRVLRILEYVGFSGNRSIGITELDQSIELEDGLRSTLSALITLVYHSYIENIFGLGNYEPEKVEQVSELLLRQHPESAFFLLFRGRYHQMLGRLDDAIETFQKSIDAQDDWVQFHSICHWEMMWCHAARMDWTRAAHYADLLRKRSKWSPASYTYQYATFLYAQLIEDQRARQAAIIHDSSYHNNTANMSKDSDAKRLDEIVELMKTVPSLRVRIAGKTVPAEKFAIVRSGKFLEEGNRLTLPALEFLYIWNIFVYLRNCPKELEKLLVRIEEEINYMTSNGETHNLYNGNNAGDPSEASTNVNDTHSTVDRQTVTNDDKHTDGDQQAEDEDDRKSASSSGVHSTQSELQSTTTNESSTSEQCKRDHQNNKQCNNKRSQNSININRREDDYYITQLLKGMCLKQLGLLEEADRVLSQLVEANELIKEDTFIVPHAAMELALLKLLRRQFDEAKQIVKMVRNDHTGYLHETMVHFKLHAASRLIRLEQQQKQLEHSASSRSNSVDE